MTTTITLNVTQADLGLILLATTRLLTYCTDQKSRGNTYAGAHVPHLVQINHQLATRLQILNGADPPDTATPLH